MAHYNLLSTLQSEQCNSMAWSVQYDCCSYLFGLVLSICKCYSHCKWVLSQSAKGCYAELEQVQQ